MQIDRRLAERLEKINPSSTLAITSKAKKLKQEGRDIISLAAGEPDFDTPDFIKAAGIKAIQSGFTKYTPTTGTPELKKSISEKFKHDNSLEYSPAQIIVSCGAKHSIFNSLYVLLNPLDEVLIPSPYWVSYPEMVNLLGAVPRFVKTSEKNSFKVTVDDLKQHSGGKTKLLILNSPSNPVGCVYNRDELKKIAEFCVKNKIFVISDEIYEKLIYDGQEHISIASFGSSIYDLTVTVNGLSKSFSMTGWRIGYLGAPQDIASAIAKLQDHTTSCPTSISQFAAQAALSAPNDFTKDMVSEFQKRRDYAVKRLSSMEKIKFIKPAGAFYIFCNIGQTKLDSLAVANRLLEEASVAVIPGEGFGKNDYIRISFAASLEQITKGLDRIEQWISKL